MVRDQQSSPDRFIYEECLLVNRTPKAHDVRPIDTSCAYVRRAGVRICAAPSCREAARFSPQYSCDVTGTIFLGAGRGDWCRVLEAMTVAARVDDELSEEQFQGSDQIQEDELLALQAIYGDDMVIFDNMDGLRFFQISLHYQLQGEIHVYMNVSTNDGTTETGDEDDDEEDANDDGLLYACTLQHLPTITLTCLLPRSYPSTRAPYYVIAAKWLDEPEVSRFCSVLDGIWAELPGQEVVYRWADWLSGSSWSCIASDNQMVLGPDTSSSAAGADERAIGRSL